MTATLIDPLASFIEKTFVITEFELRKLRHDFTELVTRALQPALWLLIFGEVFSRSGAMHTGNIPYLDFIAPGILAQSVLFTVSTSSGSATSALCRNSSPAPLRARHWCSARASPLVFALSRKLSSSTVSRCFLG
jgi:hypothetical protein